MAVLVQHPTASWDAFQDGSSFFRRQEVYKMQWSIPVLDQFIVSGAGRGGPLALIRDQSQVVEYGRQLSTKPQIQIYSASGALIRTIPWDLGKIVKMQWNFDEQLVVLNEEGTYRVYELLGEYEQHSLGQDAQDSGVVDAKMHEGGFVALLGNLSFLEIKGWAGGKPLQLASAGLSHPPPCWDIIPPDQTISRHVEVLISHETTVLSLDNLECVDQRLSRGPFSRLAVSPNGKALALLTSDGILWVVSSDFQQSFADYDTKIEGLSGKPKQLVWCGNDTLVMNWNEEGVILMVGPFGSTLKYYYTSPTYLHSESDGIRITSSETCDFLQKVPPASEQVFKPGTTSSAAILFDAYELFESKNPKADEKLRSIRPDLASAVDICIQAAGNEWENYWQKRLLNAALYGRAFLDLYNPTDFVEMGQALKVLNAVRYYEIGIPITYAQYALSSPTHLISRLTSRNLHLLALRISSFLHLPPDIVLRHWASAKIAQRSATGTKGKTTTKGDATDIEEDEDEEVCRAIVEKFEGVGVTTGKGVGVSYAEVARKAWIAGRTRLATKLLDHEPNTGDQVPLLLSMKEDKLALTKAVDSGDTDLVYDVLLHLKRRLPLGSFFSLIESGGATLAPAASLLQVYAKSQDREMLRDFWYAEDRRLESAVLALEDAGTMENVGAKIESVKAAAKFFSEDKERAFEAKMMDENLKLLIFQQQVEGDMDGNIKLIGLSVTETIRACLVAGLSKKAEKLRSDFKVPDKRFWYTKLYALTDIKDFEGLETFAKSKRSPIGYEPFVSHLVSKGFSKQALGYVARCDAKARPDLYVKCGEWRLAGVECKERGDKAKLQELRKSAPNNLVARELDQILSSIG